MFVPSGRVANDVIVESSPALPRHDIGTISQSSEKSHAVTEKNIRSTNNGTLSYNRRRRRGDFENGHCHRTTATRGSSTNDDYSDRAAVDVVVVLGERKGGTG
jgi:hypothetical protein